jgi:glycosyltransferase involved in cell wall biosynthesis
MWELRRRPVHVLFVPAHTLPVFMPRSIKSVVTIHDLGYEYLPQYHKFPDRLWLNKSTEYAVRHADRLIAVSEATKEDLIAKLSAPADKIYVVHEGFGLSLRSSTGSSLERYALEKYHLMNPYILFIGSIQPRKNLVRAIEAFSKVITAPEIVSKYSRLEFVLIGKKGWLYDDIIAAPQNLGIEERVRFLGHVPDDEAVAILTKALCFVYPSLFEGFGIPIIEAQASGVPVVTSNKKPFTEVGGDSCVYVDPESVNEIVSGIKKVLLDDYVVKTLRKKGVENSKRFSWRKAAEETLALFTFS